MREMKFSKKQIRLFLIVTAVFLFLAAAFALHLVRAKTYVFDPWILAPELAESDGTILIEDTEFHSTRFSLGKGTYHLFIDYASDADYSIFIPLDNDNNTTVSLPAGSGTASAELALEWPTDRAYMVFGCPAEGEVRISSISIVSDRPIYTDGIFQLILLAALYILILCFIAKSEGISSERKHLIVVLILLAAVINLPYYINLYQTDQGQWVLLDPIDSLTRFGIDTRAHLLRLEGDMYGLLDGQFPVVISPNFLNENGELTFLYPSLFLYPFALMRILGASMPFVFRLICVIINTAALLSMYYACRQMHGGIRLSVLIAAVYLFEPHRLWVMFGQGASCGAGIAYVFAPLAIAGAYRIIKGENKGAMLLAIGATGILQAHITSLILLLILMAVLLLTFIRELAGDGCRGLKTLGAGIIMAGLMNLGVIVPFLYYYTSGVNTTGLIWGNWQEVLWGFPDFITDNMSLFYFAGIILALVTAVSFRRKDRGYRMAAAMLMFTAFFFLMTLRAFPWDFLMRNSVIMRSFTDYMQIPERFYTMMAPALLLSMLLLLKDQAPGRAYRTAAAVALAAVLVYGAAVNVGIFITTGPLLYDQVTGDMNTKQLFDYLPEGEDIEPEMDFSGVASLSDWEAVESSYYHKRGTHVDYSYSTGKSGTYAELPLLNYKGYRAWDENGDPLEVLTGEKGRLKVYLNADGAPHEIHTAYKVNVFFSLLYAFSVFCMAAVIISVRKDR